MMRLEEVAVEVVVVAVVSESLKVIICVLKNAIRHRRE